MIMDFFSSCCKNFPLKDHFHSFLLVCLFSLGLLWHSIFGCLCECHYALFLNLNFLSRFRASTWIQFHCFSSFYVTWITIPTLSSFFERSFPWKPLQPELQSYKGGSSSYELPFLSYALSLFDNPVGLRVRWWWHMCLGCCRLRSQGTCVPQFIPTVG